MKKIFSIVCIIFVVVLESFAQTATHNIGVAINEVALIDIVRTGGGSTNLQGTSALKFRNPDQNTPGEPIQNPNNNSELWLNYTSIRTATRTRAIRVKSDVNPNGGISFSVLTLGAINGTGNLGTQFNDVSITTTNTKLVQGIGSCYTGVGAGNGVNLRYRAGLAGPSSFGLLVAGTTTFLVTYTLSDE